LPARAAGASVFQASVLLFICRYRLSLLSDLY
jgi:hypothetical protein